AASVRVVEASFDWDDLGSWGAWARRQPRDPRGNVAFGDAVVVDCDDCVVVGEGGTAAAMGLREMGVGHVNGATLTCPLAASESGRPGSEAGGAGGAGGGGARAGSARRPRSRWLALWGARRSSPRGPRRPRNPLHRRRRRGPRRGQRRAPRPTRTGAWRSAIPSRA